MRGWTLDAADAVTDVMAATGLDVLDGLDSLLGKSLVRQFPPEDAEPRFGMLETIREYAAEKLQESGAAEATFRRHAEHYLELAEAGAANLRGPGQSEWLERLEHEHDNLRAALRWTDERIEVELGLRLCDALSGFWRGHAHFTEGRRWLDRALSLSVGQRTGLRAGLLEGAGYLARARGDYDGAEVLLREALEIRRELGNLDDVATVLRLLGNIAYERDLDGGEELWLESLAVRPADGDQRAAAETLNNLGVAARDRHDVPAADDYYRRALEIFVGAGDEEGIARIQMNLANLDYDRGTFDDGVRHAREALGRFHAMANTWDLADCLDFLGANLSGAGRATEAARVLGASQTIREAIGAVRGTRDQEEYDKYSATAREQLTAAVYGEAFAAGASMTVDEIVDEVLAQMQ